MLSCDIEINPGPKSSYRNCFSICHWNLNSISVQSYTKVSLLAAYNLIHNFDIICISETFLYSETAANDPNLEISGHNMYHADHPSNCKRGVCIFYKATLHLRVLNIPNLNECINFEVTIANKFCRFINPYRSPTLTQEEFQIFRSNLELNIDSLSSCNPFLTIMIGGFNAKSKQWCKTDKTSFEGSQLQLLTSKFGLSQIFTEPTHILENSRSCLDLLFTPQPNMVMDSGVHASLHPHCHHQIIFAKFDLKVFYPPTSERAVWHFSQANSDHIKRAVDLLDWESTLIHLDVYEQVSAFHDTISNIMSNFVPNVITIRYHRDPSWMKCHIKNLILYKTNFYKTFIRGKNSMFHHLTVNNLQTI